MCSDFESCFEQLNIVTQRGFVPVDERMQVLDAEGNKVSRFRV